MKKFLQQALDNNGLDLPEATQQKILTYLDLMQHWNQAFNLTAIHNPNEMILLHIIDSLTINLYLHGSRILDVGTGAGLPGIPLALVNPDKHFLLLDSNSKKTRFLTHVKHELKLDNVEVLHARCEDFHSEKCFDTIVSRAFAAIKVMLAATQHLICPDGQFLAMKGVYPEQEIADVPDGFRVFSVHGLQIKGLDVERCLVCIAKE